MFDLPAKKLVYVWRNFEFTGIPEEMAIYANGDVRYRNLLHTQTTIKIITDKLYSKEGGAHLLAVAFASEQPTYPGLRFESPRPLPKTGGNSNSPQFFRPDNTQQRFEGTIYTFLALDANEDIYVSSRADFDALVHSMVIDSK